MTWYKLNSVALKMEGHSYYCEHCYLFYTLTTDPENGPVCRRCRQKLILLIVSELRTIFNWIKFIFFKDLYNGYSITYTNQVIILYYNFLLFQPKFQWTWRCSWIHRKKADFEHLSWCQFRNHPTINFICHFQKSKLTQ